MDFQVDAHAVDLILGLVVLEAIAFVAFRARLGPGLRPARIVWNLLAGAALLVALRSALAGSHWHWIAAALAVSLVAHVGDLWQRRRER